MDLEQMRRLTENMEDVNSGTNGNKISLEEAKKLNDAGVEAAQKGDFDRAVKLFRKCAESGDAWGMINLATAYKNGYGVTKSDTEAFYWYKKSAECGHRSAMYKIGIFYYLGEGTNKDVAQAFSWLKKAAEEGHVNAMNWTASMYQKGDGVMQDYWQAVNWHKKAADNGHNDSMLSLGIMYATGEGVLGKDLNLAFDWMVKALKAGCIDAVDYLLQIYPYIYLNNGKYDLDILYSEKEKLNNLIEECLIKAKNEGNPEAEKKLYEFYNSNNRSSSSNSDSCFITTAVCDSFGKADDCYELTAFRNFRDSWLDKQSDGKILIAEYYDVAPKIVEKINSLSNSAEIYKNIWTDYLSECLKSIEDGDNLNCKKIYVEMVNTLKEKFLR